MGKYAALPSLFPIVTRGENDIKSINMEREIEKIKFKKFEDFWMADLSFNKKETTFEIYDEVLNEGKIQKIILELENKVLILDKEGRCLLSKLSSIFWQHDKNSHFTFSGFVIDEMTKSTFLDFRMCYHCYGEDQFSDYANWFVDVKDFRIVGCRRQEI